MAGVDVVIGSGICFRRVGSRDARVRHHSRKKERKEEEGENGVCDQQQVRGIETPLSVEGGLLLHSCHQTQGQNIRGVEVEEKEKVGMTEMTLGKRRTCRRKEHWFYFQIHEQPVFLISFLAVDLLLLLLRRRRH